MAVAPTGAIYKALEFDGVSSRTYGVYITGEAVYNAPERDVEMITIPGRNGSFALDNGRFQNIEVSYPAGIFAETEADFRAAISDFRNFLCSRNGYVRLQDEYNPDEYRMAVYKSGLEVTPAQLKAGEFTITFDCKPQRWLTSGESVVSVDSGDTITNPTLFDSSPLLMIRPNSNGDIYINGEKAITITADAIGKTKIYDAKVVQELSCSVEINDEFLNPGDQICWESVAHITFRATIDAGTVTSADGPIREPAGLINPYRANNTQISWQGLVTPYPYAYYGTPRTETSSYAITIGTSNYGDVTATGDLSFVYDGQKTVTVSMTCSIPHFTLGNIQTYMPTNYAISSRSILNDKVYIDLDIGEAYVIENDTIASVNDVIILPSRLPVLSPGSNIITYDYITTYGIAVTPRWWKI